MKLMVCGASGYIGARLVAMARDRFEVLATSSRGTAGTLALDLAHPDVADLSRVDPGDVVLLTAAISSPDICAKEPERARAVNVHGTRRLIERVLSRGARVAFFSSDTVYGERAEAFDESAPCVPAGDYAAMKRDIEICFAGEPGFKALRLSYVFSRDDKFTRFLASCAQRGESAEVFDPFVRAIVHREDVVQGTLALAEHWDNFADHQVLNFGGPQPLSRVDCADILREQVWPALTYRVVQPDAAFFVNRPRYIAMQSPLLSRLLARPQRTLAAAAALEFPTPHGGLN